MQSSLTTTTKITGTNTMNTENNNNSSTQPNNGESTMKTNQHKPGNSPSSTTTTTKPATEPMDQVKGLFGGVKERATTTSMKDLREKQQTNKRTLAGEALETGVIVATVAVATPLLIAGAGAYKASIGLFKAAGGVIGFGSKTREKVETWTEKGAKQEAPTQPQATIIMDSNKAEAGK